MVTTRETERQRMVREHAEDLLLRFGLSAGGWTFVWNRRRRKIGLCYFPHAGRPGRIELSVYHAELHDFAEVDDTIRHEIAHALAGQEAGHGPLWVAMCGITGARPDRLGGSVLPGKWEAACPSCGIVYRRYRRPVCLERWFCPPCGQETGPLTWQVQTRRPVSPVEAESHS